MRSICFLARMPFSVFLFFLCLGAIPALAFNDQGSDRQLCDRAAHRAAKEYGVPVKILKAIARTESGVTVDGVFIPWPWSINVAGQGARFQTLREAAAHFQRHHASGARNIDLGCFQINHMWHGANFETAEAMLDPLSNARYAARFLKSLHQEFGDWSQAAGAFHSRNHEFSSKYLARFVPILRALNGEAMPSQQMAEIERINAFPLLTGTSSSPVTGSLFPTSALSRGSLLARDGGRG